MRKPDTSQHRLVRFGVFDSPLGKALVAATPAGVCVVAFADTVDELTMALQRRTPRGKLCEDTAAVTPFAHALLASLSGEVPTSVPLDVQGTAFQQRVWAALQAIPRGSTRTYTQIAHAVGLPGTSARAVAQACAANPVAVAIPCHRVVGADGALRGYRWGMERKRRLLLLERTPV